MHILSLVHLKKNIKTLKVTKSKNATRRTNICRYWIQYTLEAKITIFKIRRRKYIMIFTNAKLYGSNENYTIEIENKKIKKLKSQQCNIKSKKEVIDLKGKLVLPPFVESHIHLDYAFSVGDPYWNESGTLFEAIHIWSKRKKEKKETKSQIKNRATKAINSLIKNGVQHIRSHVDITSPELTGLQALLELKSEFKKWIDLQLVAFPQEGLISYPNGEELMEESIKMGV